MAVYSVDSDAVLSTTAAMRAAMDRVQAENQSMLMLLTQLQSSWTGSASLAFQGVTEQWRAAQRQIDDALLSINTALGAAGRQYAETEQAALGLFR